MLNTNSNRNGVFEDATVDNSIANLHFIINTQNGFVYSAIIVVVTCEPITVKYTIISEK